MKAQVSALQEEGGATWSYSQGEIEDLLQSKQRLPPQLQQLMDARSAFAELMDHLPLPEELFYVKKPCSMPAHTSASA